MSYDICIERDPPFDLAEWTRAIEATDGVRLNAADVAATNPQTGEVISVGRQRGDADICIDAAWYPCFRWRESGSVVFKAPLDWEEKHSVVRKVARVLVRRLRACLIGDGGEEYD